MVHLGAVCKMCGGEELPRNIKDGLCSKCYDKVSKRNWVRQHSAELQNFLSLWQKIQEWYATDNYGTKHYCGFSVFCVCGAELKQPCKLKSLGELVEEMLNHAEKCHGIDWYEFAYDFKGKRSISDVFFAFIKWWLYYHKSGIGFDNWYGFKPKTKPKILPPREVSWDLVP
jgi:hypothetical protein